jgi:alpha-1,2-mannosyltransferase
MSRRLAAVAVAACIAAEGVWLALLAARHEPLDLRIYSWGGHAVRHDAALYQLRAFGHWFTYPPFAAVSFIPVAALPSRVAQVLWLLASLAALGYLCRALLQLARLTASWSAVATAMAATLALEPVRHTFALGQVNLLLMALVVWDVRRTAAGKPAGVGVGIATAVKLTPAVFIVVLVASRRWRSAAIAVATFLTATAVGWLVAPAASSRYWLHLFFDTGRVGAPYISNQSPYGAAARLLGGVGHVGGWWSVAAAVFAAVGVATAAVFARRDDWLAAIAATGITSLLVSPISWTHHWVWAVPALLVLLRSGGRGERTGAAVGYLLFVVGPMWFTPHHGGPSEYGFHGVVSLVANSYLVAALALLVYLARGAMHARSDGGPASATGAGRSRLVGSGAECAVPM